MDQVKVGADQVSRLVVVVRHNGLDERHQIRPQVLYPRGEHVATARPITKESLRVLHQDAHGHQLLSYQ